MKHFNRLPFLSLALLAAWLVAGTAAISLTDPAPDTPYLAYAMLVFTTVLVAANLFRFSVVVAILVGVGVYAGTMLSLRPLTPPAAVPLGIGVAAITGAGLLGWLAARQIALLQKKLIHTNSVLDDLRIKDPILGAVRLPYAMQTLKKEALRSQRYKSGLCLLMLDIADQETIKHEQGLLAYQELKRQVCGIAGGLIRELDLLFSEGPIGLILPETNTEGALIVARRISDSLARKLRVGIHMGIAEFGVDAFGENELYRAAETALALAQRTDKPIVTYSQVQAVTEPESEKAKS